MDALSTVDALELALSIVVALEGLSLLVVGLQAVTNDVSLVIAADNELVAADIADISHARRICLDVVGCTAAQADTTAGHALLDDLVRYLESQSTVDLCDLVECLSLRDRARKAVKDEAALAVALCDALLEQVDDELVRYSLPASMYSLADWPRGVLFLIASRRMLPVEMLGTPIFSIR